MAAEKPNRPNASVRKLEVVNAATGKLSSIQITLRCGKTFFKATVDTGSPASFVNKKTADYILKTVLSAKVFTVQESPIDTVYVDYNRKRIELMGILILDVSSLGWHVKSAKFLISENRTRCLLGLDMQPHLGVRTTQVRPDRPLVGEVSQSNLNITSESWKTDFHQKFHRVFTRVVKAKNHKVFSTFKSPLVLIQEKGRRVPVHIQDKVGQGFQKLFQEGHVVKLNKCTSEHFISPIVITAKKDGSVKLAMDAKPMDDQIHKNQYQMLNLLELLDSAAQIITSDTLGDVWFTFLDLKYAFSQIPLSDEVSRHCNFNIVCGEQTGPYRFKTGFYGLTDMPEEFQKAMDNTLQGLSGVFCFLDDILIVSKGSILDHNILVDKVRTRLGEEGFALKLSKCDFSLNQLSWLGYDIDSEGYRPKRSKIEAVLALEPPRTLKQLRSFMGILNHLQRLLPNLQVHSDQLRPSLKASNKSKFVWGECQQTAFSNILHLIANITKMYQYDQSRNSRVKCDASHSGLGAALEQEIEKDVWVPSVFASRFLNDQEKKYSTNELELRAIVWSCERFRNYLLGNHFVVLTDHKAIISALTTNRGNKIHQSQLTRWADRLLPFDFDIFYISGCKLGIVDCLSRFPTSEAPRPSSFDEQYVVKSNSRFFDACDFLDEWARCCSLLKESPTITKNSQNSAVSNTINLIESLDFGQPRANRPVMDNSIVPSNKFGSLSVEGALIQNIPATSQGIKSIEGDKSLYQLRAFISIEGDSKYIGLSQQFNTFVTSPLEGVKIAGLKKCQSALREIMQVFVTFSAWITYYLPVLISVWIITLAVSDCDFLLSFIDFFVFVSSYRFCWSVIVLLGFIGCFSFSDCNGF